MIGDPAPERLRVARQARTNTFIRPEVVGQRRPPPERGLAHEQRPAACLHLEEHAEREFDGAVDALDRVEEEQHPIPLDEIGEPHDSSRHAAGADPPGLTHDDRAARDEALQHLLDLEHEVGRRDAVHGRRFGRDDFAEHDDG
ncbi:MAG: hypothetical protein F4230_07775 [Holophagales bacterium]|nr:hypothetical protein [Holophagales bacterium]